MEIRWVDRDGLGQIKGHYARKQDHHGENDFVADDAPELLAFDAAMKAQMEAAQAAALAKDAKVTELEATIASMTAKIAAIEAKIPK